ncbi:MAG: SDR family NAD(P)-dependent oxidoreductase, partial [Bdellovibrionales bacterium]|nr:SDR family NAD(P)-dependent oxidoreductase [Bdellovibrionales bacterium]
IDEGDIDQWDQMIDSNIKGLLYVSRYCLPFMKKRSSSHIVNIGSVAGRWVYPGGNVYCATKHAVRAISEAMRMDLIGSSIRVTNIEPGMVHTEFSLVRLGDEKKANEVYKNMKPLEAKDVAESIYWCIERPAHVNIHEMVIYPTDQAHVTMINRN